MKKVSSEYLDSLVVHDKENGIYRHNRESFTNENLFELEMEHIFESNWVYLAHESQIPNINDYYTTSIGRQSVVITKDKQGELNALINSCTHKGAQLCRYKKGNKSSFTCPFHGWTFSNAGKLLKVKDGKTGGYPTQFNCEGSHDLVKVAKFEAYKGFLFGSINPEVLPLQEYLGDSKVIIDHIVDQAADGLEVLNGSSSYVYNGNWKLQMENGADGYHVSSVHWNYVATMGRRDYEKEGTKAVDANNWSKSVAGVYGFENGHILLWTNKLNPEVSPIYQQQDRLIAEFGAEKAGFMVNMTRNLGLYPNVFLMDQFSTQIRVIRPISVNETEITIYCFAPKGESGEERATRIRQYEDFFNVTGMGTPDDLEEFRSCQIAYQSSALKYNDMSRGATHWLYGQDEQAEKMGIKPIISGIKSEDEGLFITQHEFWKNSLKEGISKNVLAENKS
ncbi:Rieske 2Fe-2S domain-containing protein [Pedobacter sp. PLR]|uniref:Rieske 2Fe-2S domain-containing protein n=1 Tax=Pedobacter sp. PLR TaxID=2994465 RepID=UPI0022465E27|nr:Rieske 2Fe-2S domain-containing protein [Pedobacter sp. PLR]MCX2452305.1 Rieske 2Fe-2S domain-containing protein [Pedobacter sp. PLR]